MNTYKNPLAWALFSLSLISSMVLTYFNGVGSDLNHYFLPLCTAAIGSYLIYMYRESILIGLSLICVTGLVSTEPFLAGFVFSFSAILALLNKDTSSKMCYKDKSKKIFWLAIVGLASFSLALNSPLLDDILPSQLYDNFNVTLAALQLLLSYKVIYCYEEKLKPFLITLIVFLISKWEIFFLIMVLLNWSIKGYRP